jgi:hypothetical protein
MYCWHPIDDLQPTSSNHNPGCPVLNGNYQEWEEGAAWGWNDSTAPRREWPGSRTFQLGIREGQTEMEKLVQDAAENLSLRIHEPEY